MMSINKIILLSSLVLFSASSFAHSEKSVAHKAKKQATKVHRTKEAVKTVSSSPTKEIDSNAYNFKSSVSASVNPQTGQLATSITLGHLSAHKLGPDFTLTAHYNQNSQTNRFDLGEGWSYNFTTYDQKTNTLETANGASYRASPVSGSCIYSIPKGVTLPNVASCEPQNFQYHKMKDIILNVYCTSSGNFAGAQVIYKDGHREIIDANSRLINIIYPRGFNVSLNYSVVSNMFVPTSITDNFGDEISFQNVSGQITSRIDGKNHTVSINAGSGAVNLWKVTEGGYITQFDYQSGTTPTNLLNRITYASGAQDLINYGLQGEGLPILLAGGQKQYLPVVKKLQEIPSTPGEKTMIIKYTYGQEAYLTYNYTGFPKYSPSSAEDVLFANPAQFLYETTENVSLGYNDDNSSVEKITRTYEHHHYLMEKKIQGYNMGTGEVTTVKDTFYSYCSGVNPGPVGLTGKYPGQACIMSTPGSLPVTSGLPAAVQVVSYDQAGNKHTAQTLIQYDNSGNVTESIACSDADVVNSTCAFGKTTSSIINNTQYATPLVTGGITNTVLSTNIVTPFDGTRSIVNGLQTLPGIDGLSYQEPGTITTNFQAVEKPSAQGLITTTNTWKDGYISNAKLAFAKNSPLHNYGGSHLKSMEVSYTRSTNAANHTFTITKHLVNLSSSKTYDSPSGLLVSETDNAGRVTTHQYDSLGRVTSVSKFSDTSNSLKTTYQYQLPSGGVESIIETDPKSATQSSPYEVKTVFDSLGKPIAHYDNMDSTGGATSKGSMTELSSELYNSAGKVVMQSEGDVTSTAGKAKASYYFYNMAGEKIATLYPNGTFSVTINNAPNNLEMNYLAGIPKGKTAWVFNGFKVVQKVPRTSAAFTSTAKNPSDVVLNTYILPADPVGKKADDKTDVYSSAVQTQLSGLESQIGGVLTQLAQEKNNAQTGYAMKLGQLENLNAQLASFAAQAITAKQYYSSSDAVYDSFAQEISKKDVNGNTTRMQYDGLGRNVLITNPLGHVTHIYYNIINKPICLALGATVSSTDACVAALNK